MKKEIVKREKLVNSSKSKKGPTTKKKVKVVGTEYYTNQNTGEITEMQVIKLEERDFNFEKIWFYHILESLNLVGGAKMKVLTTLLELKNKENIVITTHKKLMELTKVSRPIISETLKLLVESNFLVKKQTGVYIINPQMLFNGGQSARLNVLYEYTNSKESMKETQVSENPDTFVQSEDKAND